MLLCICTYTKTIYIHTYNSNMDNIIIHIYLHTPMYIIDMLRYILYAYGAYIYIYIYLFMWFIGVSIGLNQGCGISGGNGRVSPELLLQGTW